MTRPTWNHPVIKRRTAVQAGAIGLLGLGMNHVDGLKAAAAKPASENATAKSCIYIFYTARLELKFKLFHTYITHVLYRLH